jgi:hypothetical protein
MTAPIDLESLRRITAAFDLAINRCDLWPSERTQIREAARYWKAALAEHDAQPAPAPVHPCTMGVGCEEAGVCYASANGQPEQCGAHPPAPAADGAGEHVAMLESMIADHAWIPGVKERAALRAAIAALRQPVPDAVRELIDVGCRIRLASDSNMDRTRLSPKDEKDLHLALERAIASQQESRE